MTRWVRSLLQTIAECSFLIHCYSLIIQARCSFLSFVWGRSRLPTSSTGFDRPFKITRMYKYDTIAVGHIITHHMYWR